MNLQQVEDGFYISDQIQLAELKFLSEKGIKTIICNRPDDEEYGQINFEQIKGEAEKYGISAYYLPYNPHDDLTETAEQLNQLHRQSDQLSLAYCKSGYRSIVLWALGQRQSQFVGDILKTTQACGFNISAIFSR